MTRHMTPAEVEEMWGRYHRGETAATIPEAVARSVCGLVRTTPVFRRCDRDADEMAPAAV